MSLGTQGHGMLLLVNVCSTLLCYARCVFCGTLSRVQGPISHWLAGLLPRQQASTAALVLDCSLVEWCCIDWPLEFQHASDPSRLSASRCQPAVEVYSLRQPARVLRQLARLSSQLAGARARPSRWPSARRIKAHCKLISMPTHTPPDQSKQTPEHGPASVH